MVIRQQLEGVHEYYESSLFEGISIAFCFPFGSVDENKLETGFAHLLEHVLAKRIQRQLKELTEHMNNAEFHYSAHSYPFHTEFIVELHADTQEAYTRLLKTAYKALFDDAPIYRNEVTPEVHIIDREVSLRIGSNPLGLIPWAFAGSIVSPEYKGKYSNSFSTTQRMNTAAGLEDLNRWKLKFTQTNCSIAFTAHPRYQPCVSDFIMRLDQKKSKHISFLDQFHAKLSGFQKNELVQQSAEKPAGSIGLMTRIIPDSLTSTYSWQRGVYAVLVEIIKRLSPKCSISSGFFGAFHGPDYRIILEVFSDSPVLQQASSLKITNNILQAARLQKLQQFKQLLKEQRSVTAVIARDALFDLNHLETIESLKNVDLSEIQQYVHDLLNQPYSLHYFADKGTMITP